MDKLYKNLPDVTLRETLTRRMAMFDLREVRAFIWKRYKKHMIGELTSLQKEDFLRCTHTGKIVDPDLEEKSAPSDDHWRK